jgi:predicted amidohydrolase
MICYDNQFPESARCLVLGGAQILVMPTAWPMTGDGGPNDAGGELYDSLTRVRAQENQSWLVAADQVGAEDRGSGSFFGHSRIVAPTGSIIADAGLEEGLALASVDLTAGLRDGMLRTLPPGLDYLKDRRPDTYGRICESGARWDEPQLER